MTATDELRKLLDERGVKYEMADSWWTSWDTDGALSIGAVVYCEDLGSGLEIRWHTITPEQAIAATLGSDNADADNALALLDEIREAGRISYDDYSQLFDAIAAWNTRAERTCELSVCGWDNDIIQCMACGAYWEHQQFDSPDYYPVNYCPNCGAKVVNE